MQRSPAALRFRAARAGRAVFTGSPGAKYTQMSYKNYTILHKIRQLVLCTINKFFTF